MSDFRASLFLFRKQMFQKEFGRNLQVFNGLKEYKKIVEQIFCPTI